MLNLILQYAGFGTCVVGVAQMSLGFLLPGLVTSLIGDMILVIYGYTTDQHALAISNIIYSTIVVVGLIKYFKNRRLK